MVVKVSVAEARTEFNTANATFIETIDAIASILSKEKIDAQATQEYIGAVTYNLQSLQSSRATLTVRQQRLIDAINALKAAPSYSAAIENSIKANNDLVRYANNISKPIIEYLRSNQAVQGSIDPRALNLANIRAWNTLVDEAQLYGDPSPMQPEAEQSAAASPTKSTPPQSKRRGPFRSPK